MRESDEEGVVRRTLTFGCGLETAFCALLPPRITGFKEREVDAKLTRLSKCPDSSKARLLRQLLQSNDNEQQVARQASKPNVPYFVRELARIQRSASRFIKISCCHQV